MKSIVAVVVAGLLFALVLSGPVFPAEIILTPGGTTSIQDAVSASSNGDVIILTDGVYFKTGDFGVDFEGKAITLRSQNGPGSTTIDCTGSDNAISFTFAETSSSVLEGITIINGSANYGAAIYSVSASPLIRDCVFRDCTANNGGGAIYMEGIVGPTIENCEFTSCSAGSGNGGAIMVDNGANSVISRCLIYDNLAANGAGLFVNGNGGVTLDECTVYDNVASVNGGGLFATQANSGVNLSFCTFYNNSAVLGGGIRFQWVTSSNVSRCTIAENSASTNGSGVSVTGNATFVRTIVALNTGSAGFACSGGTVTVTGCMLVGGHTTNLDGSCFSGTIVQEDPQFCGIPGSRNYQLQSDSPAAGNTPGCPDMLGAEDFTCGSTPTEIRSWGAIRAMYQ